jgi:predicted DNA-binding transcriptional regulator YafY
MSGSHQQKLKLLYLYRILLEQTDEDNPMSASDLVKQLALHGINAERKSVYSDIRYIEDFGVDICKSHQPKQGYFVGARDFEMPELRLMIDAVQSAKFVTAKKARQLIKKIEKLTSLHQGKTLDKQVLIEDRQKCSNEEVYYNIDKIHEAISRNRMVAFKYFEYDINKRKQLKNRGLVYELSPFSMLWFDDRYYLIGNHDKYSNVSHYRIDRMSNVEIIDKPRRNSDEVSRYKNYFNTADYANTLFSMFSGSLERVKIRFRNHLINTVIDRFGVDVTITKEDNDWFSVLTDVRISEGFTSWLFLFGDEAEVVSPKNLRESIVKKINKLCSIYCD